MGPTKQRYLIQLPELRAWLRSVAVAPAANVDAIGKSRRFLCGGNVYIG